MNKQQLIDFFQNTTFQTVGGTIFVKTDTDLFKTRIVRRHTLDFAHFLRSVCKEHFGIRALPESTLVKVANLIGKRYRVEGLAPNNERQQELL